MAEGGHGGQLGGKDRLVGRVLGGRYRVVRPIGHGGMGTVYEGVQEDLRRRVAIKVLHADLADEQLLLQRFKREAQAAAALGNPNIVQVTDFRMGEDEPPFLVMEYVDGVSLRDVIKKEGRLDPTRTAFIFVQVLSALAAAHKANIVHRDIKPANILLMSTMAMNDIVKVCDFGIAKLIGEGDEGPRTNAGVVVGTLAYMAPEQATGMTVDGRTDLYSVGACMFQTLIGRRPIDADNTAAMLTAICTRDPPSLSALRSEVDPGLSAIVARALRKTPDGRFASAEEMATALAPFVRGSTGAHAAVAPSAPPASVTAVQPNPWSVPTAVQPVTARRPMTGDPWVEPAPTVVTPPTASPPTPLERPGAGALAGDARRYPAPSYEIAGPTEVSPPFQLPVKERVLNRTLPSEGLPLEIRPEPPRAPPAPSQSFPATSRAPSTAMPFALVPGAAPLPAPPPAAASQPSQPSQPSIPSFPSMAAVTTNTGAFTTTGPHAITGAHAVTSTGVRIHTTTAAPPKSGVLVTIVLAIVAVAALVGVAVLTVRFGPELLAPASAPSASAAAAGPAIAPTASAPPVLPGTRGCSADRVCQGQGAKFETPFFYCVPVAGKTPAAETFAIGDRVIVDDGPATIVAVPGKDKYRVHYDRYDSSFDEVVGTGRISARRCDR